MVLFQKELSLRFSLFQQPSAFWPAEMSFISGLRGEQPRRQRDYGNEKFGCLHKFFGLVFIWSVFVGVPSAHAYSTGKRSKVRNVELRIPPITTVASGRCTSAPDPLASAIGTNPRLATNAVISTGLSRVKAPSHTAFRTVRPSSRNWLK